MNVNVSIAGSQVGQKALKVPGPRTNKIILSDQRIDQPKGIVDGGRRRGQSPLYL